jgi:hypothetical protein
MKERIASKSSAIDVTRFLGLPKKAQAILIQRMPTY